MEKEINQATATGKLQGAAAGHQPIGMVTDWVVMKITLSNMETVEQQICS